MQQELGVALATQKKVVPVVWDVRPSELPGWASQFQALNLAGASLTEVQAQISSIADEIKADKAKTLLILGLWEVAWKARLISPLFFSGPSAIAKQMVYAWTKGHLKSDLVYSGTNFTLGFAGAGLAGAAPAGPPGEAGRGWLIGGRLEGRSGNIGSV